MTSTKKRPTNAFERAQKRVNEIKGFYTHLAVYIAVNSILLMAKNEFTFMVINDRAFNGIDFLAWINWNTYGTLIFWGIGLGVHALSVFVKNPFLGKAWEQRQIKKYMERE